MPTRFFLCFALITLTVLSAFSQTPTAATAADNKNKTELELFQEKYGSVIVKGFSELPATTGLGGTFQISVREVRDAVTGRKIKGLSVEVDKGDRYSTPGRSFIEYAEIDSLIKGISYIAKIDKSVTTLNSFEAVYRTKGDFEVTVFSETGGKISVGLSAGRIGAKTVFVSMDALSTIVSQLQQAKATLDAL